MIIEAIDRIITPQQSNANGMLFFAIVGVSVNGYAAYKLTKGKTLNEKVISWHLIEDVLGWLIVLIASIVLQYKEIPLLDPILSLLVTSYILFNVVKNLKKVLHLFLEGVPPEIDYNKIAFELSKIKKIQSIHHLHIWSLDGVNNAFSIHIKLDDDVNNINEIILIKQEVKKYIHPFNFNHITIEIKTKDEGV